MGRLENEHLNNCGEFRAVRDISVAPLREDDLTVLLRAMDSESGVKNRKSSSINEANSMSRDFQYGVSWQQNDDYMFSYMMSDSDENFENTIARKTRKTKHLNVVDPVSGLVLSRIMAEFL